MVDELAQTWQVHVVALLPAGANSVVLSCRTADGGYVVLKLTPEVSIAAQEAAALQAWAKCTHVVGLLACDIERGALLLESVQPGQKLSDDAGGWSLDDVAPLFAELWRPPATGADTGLPELSERVDVVFGLARRRVQRRPAVNARIDRDLMGRSHARSRELAVDGPVGLVHGDLHPGNVLRAGGRGVVAIDPRPCRGDQAMDAVDWMLTDVTDEQALDRRIDWLARTVAAVDPVRVGAWCQAMAVIVAASTLARRADDPTGQFLLRFAGALR